MIRGRLGAYDLIGSTLVVLFAAWQVASALARTADPWPQVALIAAATTAYVVGRVRGGRHPVFVPAVIVVSVLIGTVAGGPAALFGGHHAPPLGYTNANGALFTVGVGAACIVATVANREPARRVAGVLAFTLLGLAVVSLSQAAIVLAVGVLLIAVTAHRLGRWAVLAGPLAVLATVAVTIVLGLTRGNPAFPRLVTALSDRRTLLWQEAMEMTAAEPVFGVGPGMFAQTSPTALADADARWAHSGYLQVAAETGVVGAVLLGLLLLWVFGALYRSGQDLRLVVIGAATVTAFTVHAGIDYLLHFPALVIVAALLTGLASSRLRVP